MSPKTGNKTVATDAKVDAFLAKEKDPRRRADCEQLVSLMSDITGKPAVMWGAAIVGFDRYHYKYASGREGDSLVIGFSPRKAALTVYAMGGVWEEPGRLKALGKCTGGGACLYVKSLADIDLAQLRIALTEAMRRTHAAYPAGGASSVAAAPAKKKAAKKTAKKPLKKTAKKVARKTAKKSARKTSR